MVERLVRRRGFMKVNQGFFLARFTGSGLTLTEL
jgi:hypothetical protein